MQKKFVFYCFLNTYKNSNIIYQTVQLNSIITIIIPKIIKYRGQKTNGKIRLLTGQVIS